MSGHKFQNSVVKQCFLDLNGCSYGGKMRGWALVGGGGIQVEVTLRGTQPSPTESPFFLYQAHLGIETQPDGTPLLL